MKIGVLIKEVPDTASRIRIAGDGTSIEQRDIKWIVNPYDEFAYEQALLLKKATGGSVTAILLGPSRAAEALRSCLAVGCDRAIHLSDGFEGSDFRGVSKALAAVIEKEELQVVFAGKAAIDDGASVVPQMVAEALGYASVTNIIEFDHQDDAAVVAQAAGGGALRRLKATYPAVFTCDKGLNSPRLPNIRGIVMARSKKIESFSPDDLGVEDVVGADNRELELLSFGEPPARPAGQIIDGADAAEKAAKLVALLRNEAKVL